MTLYQNTSKLYLILITGILLFPFEIKFSVFCLFIYLVGSSSLNKPEMVSDKMSRYLLSLPVLFYLLYAFSLFYTENIAHGVRDLETKATLIIIPLAIIFYQRKQHDREEFSFWFVVAFLVASVYLLIQAFFEWHASNDSQSFFYDRFSDLMHPTYFTMCLTLSVILLNECKAKGCQNVMTGNVLYYAVLFVFIVSMFLTSSRAGLTIGWLLIFTQFIFYLFKRRITFLPLSLFIAFIIFSVSFLSPSDSRFKILISEVTSSGSNDSGADTAKVDVAPVTHRLTLYKSALSVAADHPFGVGVGDVQDELVNVYHKIGYTKAAEVRYNPHNQFLQTAVAIGWPGLIVLLTFLAGLFLHGLRMEDIPLSGLAALTGLNALFESVFEVQRGVLFFAFSLLFLLVNRDENRVNTG